MGQASKRTRGELRVAIVGLGPIGRTVAEALDRGIYRLHLTAVAVQNPENHRTFLVALKQPPAVVPIDRLADLADSARSSKQKRNCNARGATGIFVNRVRLPF